jgi:hypothetical protein
MGRITPIMNYIRRVLIEEIYARLSKAICVWVEVDHALTYVV